MVRKTLILWAGVTLVLAVLNMVFVFTFPGETIMWNLARTAASLFIIGYAVVTWRVLRPDASQPKLNGLVSIGAVGLIVLGVAGMTNAIYLGQTTGDFEYYLFPIHALLIGQGAFTFWYLQMFGKKTQVRD